MVDGRTFPVLLAVLSAACGGEPKKAPPHPIVISTSGSGGEGGGSGGEASGTGGTGMPPPDPDGPPCNTWAALCGRAYDAVSYPVAHAAMANSALWSFPAQRRSIRQELDDSIRGIWLEVHAYQGEPALCFHDCSEGRMPFAPELGDVRGFLDDNPREVVTLLIDNRVPAEDIEQALTDADLVRYLSSERAQGPWPTLGEMIDSGTRLVVFLSDATGADPGYLSFDDIAETSENAHEVRELACDLVRGDEAAPFVLMNEFLVEDSASGAGGQGGAAGDDTTGRPSETLAETVNRDPELSERLRLCARFLGRKPNFVAVDFYDTSDIVTATQRLDELIPPLE